MASNVPCAAGRKRTDRLHRSPALATGTHACREDDIRCDDLCGCRTWIAIKNRTSAPARCQPRGLRLSESGLPDSSTPPSSGEGFSAWRMSMTFCSDMVPLRERIQRGLPGRAGRPDGRHQDEGIGHSSTWETCGMASPMPERANGTNVPRSLTWMRWPIRRRRRIARHTLVLRLSSRRPRGHARVVAWPANR